MQVACLLSFGPVDHSSQLDEDPTSPNPSSSSSLILPIQNTARAAGRTTGPHRLCSFATPTPAPTRVEFSSFGEGPPPPPHPTTTVPTRAPSIAPGNSGEL